ncbi:MAG: helix-turn-helix domain-containing protein [Bacteriovoracaceae bacterium]|nr:helix-turn-helix domain-containing protein [Bacteriovoracaceae bacterium]
MDSEKAKNYYEVLEVPTDASSEEIHQGYIRAKNAYSQDSLALYSLMSKDECDSILDLIDEAYTIISDPNKRRAYDQARGINQSVRTSSQPERTFANTIQMDEHVLNPKVDTTTSGNMSKTLAKNRFSLDYDVNEEFESEIEQTTEFTGELLQKIREYKKVDIPRLSDMTKVSKTYIRHIEDEEVDKLPALVYVRGFVYQYAKCLKLNPDLVATSYIFRLKQLKGEA